MEMSTAPRGYEDTTEYDYGDDSTPCHKEHLRSFGAQLLPPLYSLVFLIGLVGNVLVVLVLLQNKRLKSMTGVYLLNLAISDLLFLFTLPFWIDYFLKDSWVFGNGMCKLLSGLHYVSMFSEISFIILLTFDRYLAIVFAVFAQRARTVTFAVITSVAAWALNILTTIPGFYFSRSQKDLNGNYGCSLYFPPEYQRPWRQFQALQLNIMGLILPLGVMIVCYTGIIIVLQRRPNKNKSKAVRLIFVIMIIFFLFWTPYNLTIFLSAFHDVLLTSDCEQSQKLDLAIQVTEVIAHTHCCVNPIIYVFVGERFRRYLYQLFHRFLGTRLVKQLPFLHTETPTPETGSSTAPSTGEQDISHGF